LTTTTSLRAPALERLPVRLPSRRPEIVSVLVERDRAAEFERAALPHLAAAFRLARWLARDPHDAEDVVQEAYLRAFRYFDSFSGADPRTWLLSIVRNTFHTYRRKHPQHTDESDVDPAGLAVDGSAAVLDARREPTPDEPLLRAAERTRIDAAILELPLEFREVVVLREIEGLSYKEIAAVAGIPLGTVMSRLSRAREDLRLILVRPAVREVER
jgi:RNA polymerase sigma factor (sigma-70 family)